MTGARCFGGKRLGGRAITTREYDAMTALREGSRDREAKAAVGTGDDRNRPHERQSAAYRANLSTKERDDGSDRGAADEDRQQPTMMMRVPRRGSAFEPWQLDHRDAIGFGVDEKNTVGTEREAVFEELPSRRWELEPWRNCARLYFGDPRASVFGHEVVGANVERLRLAIDDERIARGHLSAEKLESCCFEEESCAPFTGRSALTTYPRHATATRTAQRAIDRDTDGHQRDQRQGNEELRVHRSERSFDHRWTS